MKQKIAGYLVVDAADDGCIEQPLGLDEGEGKPVGGILEWSDHPCLFATRSDARAAIERTHHYAMAFGCAAPDRRYCKIRTVVKESRRETEGGD